MRSPLPALGVTVSTRLHQPGVHHGPSGGRKQRDRACAEGDGVLPARGCRAGLVQTPDPGGGAGPAALLYPLLVFPDLQPPADPPTGTR